MRCDFAPFQAVIQHLFQLRSYHHLGVVINLKRELGEDVDQKDGRLLCHHIFELEIILANMFDDEPASVMAVHFLMISCASFVAVLCSS